jgi:hypothetical protein
MDRSKVGIRRLVISKTRNPLQRPNHLLRPGLQHAMPGSWHDDVVEVREHRRHLDAEAGEAVIVFTGDPDDGTGESAEAATKVLLTTQ